MQCEERCSCPVEWRRKEERDRISTSSLTYRMAWEMSHLLIRTTEAAIVRSWPNNLI